MVEMPCVTIFFFTTSTIVDARRPTWFKSVSPLDISRTGSSEIPARIGASQKPAGSPLAAQTIETPDHDSLTAKLLTLTPQ